MLPQRKRPIHLSPLPAGDHSSIIFVTTCTAARRPILARPEAVKLIVTAWQHANDWRIGRYVVMTDHIHFFCSPASLATHSLAKWMRYWKSLVTRRWPWPAEKPVWQRDHWDRELRRAENYANKWEYVRQNPVRHKLVSTVEDWPYQGELHVLPWS